MRLVKYTASTVVTRKSPASGSFASREDAAPMIRVPAAPAIEGPSSISCPANRSRAERMGEGLAAYQPSILSSIPFHRAGKRPMSWGRRSDHWRSSMASRAASSTRPPPSTSSSAVVTTPAAKLRRTRIHRRSFCTEGSTMALKARASRKGSRGASSHLKNTTDPPSQSRTVIVLCKKTLSCDI